VVVGVTGPGQAPGDTVALVQRTAHAARRHVERAVLADQDLTWTAYRALHVLRTQPRIEFCDVAATVGIRRSTMTVLLRDLEGRGLVRRREATDGRRLPLELTTRGRRLADTLAEAVRAEEAWILGTLDEAERRLLGELLGAVAGRLLAAALSVPR
jgi:DNA-binding MarR family transcriptional regulator